MLTVLHRFLLRTAPPRRVGVLNSHNQRTTDLIASMLFLHYVYKFQR